MEVIDNLAAIHIGILTDRFGDTNPWLRMQGCQPLTVDINTILNGVVLLQWQGQTKANHVHTPVDLQQITVSE